MLLGRSSTTDPVATQLMIKGVDESNRYLPARPSRASLSQALATGSNYLTLRRWLYPLSPKTEYTNAIMAGRLDATTPPKAICRELRYDDDLSILILLFQTTKCLTDFSKFVNAVDNWSYFAVEDKVHNAVKFYQIAAWCAHNLTMKLINFTNADHGLVAARGSANSKTSTPL